MRRGDRRLGHRPPRTAAHQRRPRSARRHQRPVDRRAHRHPRAPHRRRRRDHRDASATEAGAARDQARRPHARRHRPPRSSPPPRPSSRCPTPARSSATALGLRCGSFDLNAGVRRLRLRARRRRVDAHRRRLDHVLVVGAETLQPHHRPRRPRHVHPLRRRRGRRGARPAPDDGPGCSRWDLGCDGSRRRPARDPARAAAACPTSAETVAAARALPADGGPGGLPPRGARSSSSRRPTRSTAAGVGVDDVAWFVPHQANVRIIEAAGNRLGIPSGAHAREHRPLRQHRRRRRSRSRSPRPPTTAACSRGDLVLLSGFGAGLTWGSALLRWGRA